MLDQRTLRGKTNHCDRLGVQLGYRNESQSTSSFFLYNELASRIDIFHAYQRPRKYSPTFLVERMDGKGEMDIVET
jgi:hypothetical protein